MNSSESITKLAMAFVKFQAASENPPKLHTADTGKFSYDYAALPDILDMLRPQLKAHGLAVLQNAGSDGQYAYATTMLVHESGEWLESDPLRLPAGSTPQHAGGAVTYARRYSLTAFLGLAADEDDDAKLASTRPEAPPTDAYNSGDSYGGAPSDGSGQADPQGPATESQMRAIHKVGKDLGLEHDALRERSGLESMTDLTFEQAATMLSELNAERRESRKKK